MHSSPVRFRTIAKIKQISTTQFQQGWWSRPSEFGHLYFFLLYFSFHKRDFVCTFKQKFSFFSSSASKTKKHLFLLACAITALEFRMRIPPSVVVLCHFAFFLPPASLFFYFILFFGCLFYFVRHWPGRM